MGLGTPTRARGAIAGLLAAGLSLLALPLPVRAQVGPPSPTATPPPRGKPVTLPRGFRYFDAVDYVVTGASLGIVIGKFLIGPLGERSTNVAWDERVRSGLRENTEVARRGVRDASDVMLTTLVSYPFFEAVVIAGWYRRSPDVAAQMALMNAEAMALTAALQAMSNVLASRERPYGRDCGTIKPLQGRDCDSDDRYYSFFSGHTSQAFVSAALVCSHNSHLPLYGDGGGGVAACATSLTLAAATGVARIIGDQHYLTDVAAGALVGTLIGLAVPHFLHYDFGDEGGHTGSGHDFRLRVSPTPTGLSAHGWF